MEILKLEWGVGDPLIVDVNGDGLNDLVVPTTQSPASTCCFRRPI